MAETSIVEIKQSAEQKMGKTLEALKNDLAKVRTGRAHTGILHHVMVDYYGKPTRFAGGQVSLVDSLPSRPPCEKNLVWQDRESDSRCIGTDPRRSVSALAMPRGQRSPREIDQMVRRSRSARVAGEHPPRRHALEGHGQGQTATEDEERDPTGAKWTESSSAKFDKMWRQEKDLLHSEQSRRAYRHQATIPAAPMARTTPSSYGNGRWRSVR